MRTDIFHLRGSSQELWKAKVKLDILKSLKIENLVATGTGRESEITPNYYTSLIPA